MKRNSLGPRRFGFELSRSVGCQSSVNDPHTLVSMVGDCMVAVWERPQLQGRRGWSDDTFREDATNCKKRQERGQNEWYGGDSVHATAAPVQHSRCSLCVVNAQ